MNQVRNYIINFFKGKLPLFVAFINVGLIGGFVLNMIVWATADIIIAKYDLFLFSYGISEPKMFKFYFMIGSWTVLSVGVWRCGNKENNSWRYFSRLLYVGPLVIIFLGSSDFPMGLN